MSSFTRLFRAFLAAALAMLTLVAGFPATAVAAGAGPEDRDLLSHQSVESGHIVWEEDSLRVRVLDGATPRDADRVAIRLGPDADAQGNEVSRIKVTSATPELSFLGKPGSIHWVASQAGAGVGTGEFPGRLLTDPEVSNRLMPDSVRLRLDAVDGPGAVEAFTWHASAGTVKRHLSSTDPGLRTIVTPPKAHRPLTWTFSQPGRYRLTFTALARTQGGAEMSSPQASIMWLVGTDPDVGLPAGTTRGTTITHPVDAPEPTPTPAPAVAASPKVSATPTATVTPSPAATVRPAAAASPKPTPTPDPGQPLVLDHGHVDAFHVTVANGSLHLNLREDVTGRNVLRPAEDVVLKVKPEALRDLPANIPGSPRAYLLPIVQNHDLLWPGWETSEVRKGGVGKVDLDMQVNGPGDVHVFSSDMLGIQPVLADGGTKLPGTIVAPFPAHTHANWVFTKPGIYTFTVKATGLAGTRKLTSNTAVYTWHVGDVQVPDPTPSPTVSVTPSPSAPSTPTVAPSPPASTSPSPSVSPSLPADHVVLRRGHVDMFRVAVSGGRAVLNLREDITGIGVVRDPEKVTFVVSDAARQTVPKIGSPFDGTTAHILPMTQDPHLLWPGWDTMPTRGVFASSRIVITDVSGPGTISLSTSDGLGTQRPVLEGGRWSMPGTIRVDEPSHVHANWFFSKPGTYILKARAVGKRPDGRTSTSPARTYTVTVGGKVDTKPGAEKPAPPQPGDQPPPPAAGNVGPGAPQGATGGAPAKAAVKCIPTTIKVPATAAEVASTAGPGVTEGHFDLGARVVKGKLAFVVKDDRQSPPVWRTPGEMSFSVGKNALAKAPAGMGFIAAEGSSIHVISSVQQAGVPWLGVNTMHPSIVRGTTGPVTLRLDAVQGPGKMAVFMSGALGGGVGQRVFDNVGGPRSFTVPANTHAHPNWVFTAPGTYRVGLTATATAASGAKLNGSGTVTFHVGAAGRTTVVAKPGAPRMVEKVVGRTPSGEPCQLAATGAAVHPGHIGLAVACLLMGGVGVAWSRRRRS